MADIPSIDDKIDPQLQAYYDQLAALTAAALAGNINERDFVEQMERIVLAALLLAYLLGGGTQDTATDDAKYLERVEQNKNSVAVLADDIYSGKYTASDKQTAEEAAQKLDNRLGLWVIGLAAVYDLGKNQQPDFVIVDGELVEYTETWRVGATEHCKTCLALDGVTLTPSEWARLGLEPRSPDLACGGWNCKCSRQSEGRSSDGLENVARLLGV